MEKLKMAAYSLDWASCGDENQPCIVWINTYFRDCVCNLRGELSLALGIVSLVCWGVAELPQLITNFLTKSGHGVSLALLLTWVLGDIFNLVGCFLEPVTLPTQLYTALLYTLTTVMLVLQTLYYDYWLKWRKGGCFASNAEVEEDKRPLNPKQSEDQSSPIPTTASGSDGAAPRIDVHYMSARSLASSGTPSYGAALSYLRVRSDPSAGSPLHDSSTDNDDEDDERSPAQPHGAAPSNKTTISPSVRNGTFGATLLGLSFQAKALVEVSVSRTSFQELNSFEGSTFGQTLGWIMAAIYMGGRLPQIYLNIKRGSVEGLNPLMFLFAIVANATYVGSILVRSLEWERLKANAPWLLDAVACVLLDLFIMVQFAYYKYVYARAECSEAEHGGLTDSRKIPI